MTLARRSTRTAMPTIKIENAVDIVLHSRFGCTRPRDAAGSRPWVILVDIVVTLEGDPIDDSDFDHPDDQGVPTG